MQLWPVNVLRFWTCWTKLGPKAHRQSPTGIPNVFYFLSHLGHQVILKPFSFLFSFSSFSDYFCCPQKHFSNSSTYSGSINSQCQIKYVKIRTLHYKQKGFYFLVYYPISYINHAIHSFLGILILNLLICNINQFTFVPCNN